MSTPKIASVLARNLKYAETHNSPGLLMEGIAKAKAAGKKGTIYISCSDPRITPKEFLGLNVGEGAIIRNAGGRTSDALRTILALDALGTVDTIVVIHHTDCGMSHISESGFLAKSQEQHPEIVENLDRGKGEGIVFGAIDDPEKTVRADVEFLKGFDSLREKIDIVGVVLDTFTGVLRQVV